MRLLAIAALAAPALAEPVTYTIEGGRAPSVLSQGGRERPCIRVAAGGTVSLRMTGEGTAALAVRAFLPGRGGTAKFTVLAQGESHHARVRMQVAPDGAAGADGVAATAPELVLIHLRPGEHVVEVDAPEGVDGCVEVGGATLAAPLAAVAPPVPATPPSPPVPRAPPAVATATVAAAVAPADVAAEPAPPGELDEGRWLLRLGGLATTSDERETRATRAGGLRAAAGLFFDPGWHALVEVRFLRGEQAYLSPPLGAVASEETRVDALAAVDYRVLAEQRWHVLSAFATAGPRWLTMRSELAAPWMLGLMLGARVEASVDPQLVLDAGGDFTPRLAGSDGGNLLGGVKASWRWTGGAALRVARRWRVRVGYAGETLVLDHTDRVMHGADVSLQARFF